MKNTPTLFYVGLCTSFLVWCLMMLGAYTRLTDAGLGCPDWPACYGHWIPDSDLIRDPALHLRKAWTEMLHRYMAGLLGIGILGLMIAVLRAHSNRHRKTWTFALMIGGVLVFQALLGMWTVTLKLWPLVVMGHLMGGMTLLSLLWMVTLQQWPGLHTGLRSEDRASRVGGRVRVVAAFTLLILVLQIALGAWTSANYAALVCPDFPACQAQGSFAWDFSGAFNLGFIPGGVELLGADALKTIHMLHRIGALICTIVISMLALYLHQNAHDSILRRIAKWMSLLLFLQIVLGIMNVWGKTPLMVAVGHNGASALLLLSLITVNVALHAAAIGNRAGLDPAPYMDPHPATYARCASAPTLCRQASTTSPKGRGDHSFEGILGDYLTLCKPKVVLMMLITAFAGMCLSVQGPLPWSLCLYAIVGIGLCSAAAAVLNHLIDRKIDMQMIRTQDRPIAQQRIPYQHAILFAGALASTGLSLLVLRVNALCAGLTVLACIGYALVYSLILKHRTPQNIVIGGAAGAMPPLLGWVAMQGEIQALAWLPVLIIFAWTPPHFWALAIARQADYQQAKIPMLPVTHGIAYTKLCMLLYTILLAVLSFLPYLTGLSGIYYFIAALCLDGAFLGQMIRLYRNPSNRIASQSFGFSIIYLLLLFVALLADHYVT